jgi:hypothetical protein
MSTPSVWARSMTNVRRRAAPWAAGIALMAVPLSGAAGSPMKQADPPGDRAGDAVDQHQVILVTGSTDGLGAEVARRLADRGAHVILHGRNRKRGEALVAEIQAAGSGSAAFYAADLADLAAGQRVRRRHPARLRSPRRAGEQRRHLAERRGAAGQPGRPRTPLRRELPGRLPPDPPPPAPAGAQRSGPHRERGVRRPAAHRFRRRHAGEAYTAGRAYAQSKLAQVLFTVDLAEELDGPASRRWRCTRPPSWTPPWYAPPACRRGAPWTREPKQSSTWSLRRAWRAAPTSGGPGPPGPTTRPTTPTPVGGSATSRKP